MRKLLLLLFLFSPLFAEKFTYMVHSQGAKLSFDETTREGTLKMRGVSKLVPLFNLGEQRNMGYTHLATFLTKWKGPAYAMVAYYGFDTERNVYHAIPLELQSVDHGRELTFHVKVLNDDQVKSPTQMRDTLLYIDNFDGADPGCLFPGAGADTPGCHAK